MPPPTAASNSRSTPAVSAAENSSGPALASSALLPVTTGFECAGKASRVGRPPRLDAADDLDDEVDVGVLGDRVDVGG